MPIIDNGYELPKQVPVIGHGDADYDTFQDIADALDTVVGDISGGTGSLEARVTAIEAKYNRWPWLNITTTTTIVDGSAQFHRAYVTTGFSPTTKQLAGANTYGVGGQFILYNRPSTGADLTISVSTGNSLNLVTNGTQVIKPGQAVWFISDGASVWYSHFIEAGLITTLGVLDTTKLPAASTSQPGISQLNDTNSSTSTSQSATANQIKLLADRVAVTEKIGCGTRTTNTGLNSSDNRTFLSYTTAGFSVALDAAGTLGNGWSVYIRNASTSNLTLDPNASETINGLTTWVVFPGFYVQVVCDGSNFRLILLSGPEEMLVEKVSTGSSSAMTNSGTAQAPMNTLSLNTINGTSYSSNQITLPAGVYNIIGSVSFAGMNTGVNIILYNVTTAAQIGAQIQDNGTSATITRNSALHWSLTLASTTTIELRGGNSSVGATADGWLTSPTAGTFKSGYLLIKKVG